MAELRENRQTQYNLREPEDAQRRKDMYNLKSTNKSEAWSCHVQPQFKAPEQTVCQDYWNQQKLSSSYNEYVYIRILYILQGK